MPGAWGMMNRQRIAHEQKIEVLKIAQAAVDQL
jgi:hypothetical protein